MNYDEMANGMNKTANHTALIAEKLAPILAEILELGEPYEVSFQQMCLRQLPGHHIRADGKYVPRWYELKMKIKV